MVSERVRAGAFVSGVLLRAMLLALLLTALIHLLARTQYYATALVILLCIEQHLFGSGRISSQDPSAWMPHAEPVM